MADWRRVAKAALLADGQITPAKIEVIRTEFLSDKRIDKFELDFLLELKKEARVLDPGFTKLLNDSIRNFILVDDAISPNEVAWLRSWVYQTGKVHADGKKLMKELKLLAKKSCPEFLQLHDQVLAAPD